MQAHEGKRMRLIDADALLEKIENPYQYREIARWVNDEPTVKPKLEWIPCSERLPEVMDGTNGEC